MVFKWGDFFTSKAFQCNTKGTGSKIVDRSDQYYTFYKVATASLLTEF